MSNATHTCVFVANGYRVEQFLRRVFAEDDFSDVI